MTEEDADDPEAFAAFSNPNRLKLLRELDKPKGYAELELTPTHADEQGSEDRRISRQAIRKHLETLMEADVVERRERGQRAEFVVDRGRLFELIERLRSLTQWSRDGHDPAPPPRRGDPAKRPEGPHVVFVHAVQPGRVVELSADSDDGGAARWTLGRSESADITTEDPTLAPRQGHLERNEGRWYFEANVKAPSRAFVDWEPVEPGERTRVRSGDVIGLGATRLVVREL